MLQETPVAQGITVSRNKSEYLVPSRTESVEMAEGQQQAINSFKYIGSTASGDRNLDKDG